MNNSIMLVGHVGQKPKAINFATSGKKLVKFPLAVKEYPSSNEAHTLWVDVEAWSNLGDLVLAHVTKGREVAVQGRLALTSYTKADDGKTVDVTRPIIRLTSFHLCGRKPETKIASEPLSQEEASRGSQKNAAA